MPHPEGTTFCFQAGTYRLAGPVLAKSGDRFHRTAGNDPRRTEDRAARTSGGMAGQPASATSSCKVMTLANFTVTALSTGW